MVKVLVKKEINGEKGNVKFRDGVLNWIILKNMHYLPEDHGGNNTVTVFGADFDIKQLNDENEENEWTKPADDYDDNRGYNDTNKHTQ